MQRFLRIDPLASEYVHNSTYAYAENRVIDGIDLEGLEWYRTVGNGLSDVWYNGVKPAMDWVNSNLNPVTPIAEMVLGKGYSPNGFVESKPRAQSAVEAAVFLFPIGKAANVVEKVVTKEVISAAEKKAVTVTGNVIKGKAVEKFAAEGGATVIGEGMARVEAAASKIPGAKILNDMPKFTGTADQITSQMMQYNRKWILNEMRSGQTILDIGRDATRANPSIFYQMEQNMLKNYQKLHSESVNIVKP